MDKIFRVDGIDHKGNSDVNVGSLTCMGLDGSLVLGSFKDLGLVAGLSYSRAGLS